MVEKFIIICQNNAMIKKVRIPYNMKNISKSFIIRSNHEYQA